MAEHSKPLSQRHKASPSQQLKQVWKAAARETEEKGNAEKNGTNVETRKWGGKVTSGCPSCVPSHTSHTPGPGGRRRREPTNSHLQEGQRGGKGGRRWRSDPSVDVSVSQLNIWRHMIFTVFTVIHPIYATRRHNEPYHLEHLIFQRSHIVLIFRSLSFFVIWGSGDVF